MDDIKHRLPVKPTRFLDLLRQHIRESGLAYRTEQTYIHWVKQFIYFHNKQHPKDMGVPEVEAFLNHLAVNRDCAVNTQRIALNALVYLYKRFMGLDMGQIEFTPAKVHRRFSDTPGRASLTLSQLSAAKSENSAFISLCSATYCILSVGMEGYIGTLVMPAIMMATSAITR